MAGGNPHARPTLAEVEAPSPPKPLALTASSPPLVALQIPPIRRLAPRSPRSIMVTSPGVVLIDMGVNMAGACQIVMDDTSAAQRGDTMTIRHAEGLNANWELDQTWLTGQPEHSVYFFRAAHAVYTTHCYFERHNCGSKNSSLIAYDASSAAASPAVVPKVSRVIVWNAIGRPCSRSVNSVV